MNLDKYFTTHQRQCKGMLICLIAALFYCYEFVLRATPGIMVHQLMSAYDVSAEAIGILSVCYYYAYAPLQLPAGILIDRFGPRRLLSASAILCTIGAFLMFQFHELQIAYIAQLFIGAGSAFAFVGALKLAANWLPIHLFPLFAGLTTALGMAGAMSTDALLIKLIHWSGWHHIWLQLSIVGVLISGCMFRFLQDKPDGNQPPAEKIHLDKENSWQDFVLALKHLASHPIFWINSIVGGVLFLPITVIGTLWGVPFLMDGYGFSQEQAGLATSLIFLGMGIGGPIAGCIANQIKNRLLILRLGALSATLTCSGLLMGDSLNFFTVSCMIFAIGLSLGPQILVFPIAVDLLELKFSGTALAATNFVLMVWGIFVQPIIGKTLDYLWDGQKVAGHAVYQLADYDKALLILPALCTLALMLSFFIPKQWRKPAER